jgi:hypothetical protein
MKTVLRKLLLVPFLLALLTCDNFVLQNKNNSFKESIEDAVWIANAPLIAVRFQSSINNSNPGIVTPSGRQMVKQRVAARVQFTETGQDAFIRWAAYLADTNGTIVKELDSSVITFLQSESTDTELVIMSPPEKIGGEIVIAPITEVRPSISRFSLRDGAESLANEPIEIIFTKKLDENSFKYEDGSFFSADGFMKNIVVEKSTEYGSDDRTIVSTNTVFEDPVYNGTTLTLTPKGQYNIGEYYYVSISNGVYYTVNREKYNTQTDKIITLAASSIKNSDFKVGAGMDEFPPQPLRIVFAGEDYESNGNNIYIITQEDTGVRPTFNVQKDPDSRVLTDAWGTVNEDTVYGRVERRRFKGGRLLVGIKAQDYRSATESTSNKADVRTVEIAIDALGDNSHEVLDSMAYTEYSVSNTLVSAVNGIITGRNSDATQWDLHISRPLDISTLSDGILRIRVWLTDRYGKRTVTPYEYYIIKDTTLTVNYSAGMIRLEGGYHDDWFNSNNPDAQFSKNGVFTSDGNIRSRGLPQTCSTALEWSFSLDQSSWTDYTSIDNTAQLAVNTSVTSDGAYPVYFKMRDEMGNETAAIPLDKTVNRDMTPPHSVDFVSIPTLTAGTPPSCSFQIQAQDDLSGIDTIQVTVTGPRGDQSISSILTSAGGKAFDSQVIANHPQDAVSNTFTVTLDGNAAITGETAQPASGTYTVRATVKDYAGNEKIQSRTFTHDTRKPLFTSYTILNGNGQETNSKKGVAAYSRAFGTGTAHFVNRPLFQAQAEANDKTPDSAGSGMSRMNYIIKKGDAGSDNYKIGLAANAADGGLITFNVDLGYTAGNAASWPSNYNGAVLNFFALDGKDYSAANYAFYPMTGIPANLTAAEITLIKDNANSSTILDSAAKTKIVLTGTGGFDETGATVIFDGTGPALVKGDSNNLLGNWDENGGGRPLHQPKLTGAGGTAPLPFGAASIALVREPRISFKIRDVKTFGFDAASGLPPDADDSIAWGYAVDLDGGPAAGGDSGWNSVQYGGITWRTKSETISGGGSWTRSAETDGTETLTVSYPIPAAANAAGGGGALPNTDFLSSDITLNTSSSAASNTKALYVFFRDNAGNVVSAAHLAGNTEDTSIYTAPSHLAEQGTARNHYLFVNGLNAGDLPRYRFAVDNTPPLCDTITLKDSALSGSLSTQFIKEETGGARFTLDAANVTEKGAGIKKITITSKAITGQTNTPAINWDGNGADDVFVINTGAAPLNFEVDNGIAVNPEVSIARSNSNKTITFTFTDAVAGDKLRFAGTNLSIPGLFIDNADRYAGQQLQIEVTLEDALGNTTAAPVPAANISNILTLDKEVSGGDADDDRKKSPFVDTVTAALNGVSDSTGMAYTNTGDFTYTADFWEFGSGIEKIVFNSSNCPATVTEIQYHDGINSHTLSAGAGFTYAETGASKGTITFTGGYPRIINRTDKNTANETLKKSLVIKGTVAAGISTTFKIDSVSDRLSFSGSLPAGDVERSIIYDTDDPDITGISVTSSKISQSDGDYVNNGAGIELTLSYLENLSGLIEITFDNAGGATPFNTITSIGGVDFATSGASYPAGDTAGRTLTFTATNVFTSSGSTPGDFTITGNFTNTDPDGAKIIRVKKAKDRAGNIKTWTSGAPEVSFVLDTHEPVISTAAIQGQDATEADFTNSVTNNTLVISGADTNIYQYAVTTSASPAPSVWQTPQPAGFSGNSPWTVSGVNIGGSLTNSAGNTRYVWLKDKAGNISAAKELTFTGDTDAPAVGSAVLYHGDGKADSGFTKSASGNKLNLTSLETNPACYAITIAGGQAPAAGSNAWKTWTVSPISLENLPAVTGGELLWLKDKAGNVIASGHNLNYTMDTTPPVITSISVENSNDGYISAATAAAAVVKIRFTETGSGLWKLNFAAGSFASITSVNGNTNTPADWEFAGNVLPLKNVTGVTGTSADLTIAGVLSSAADAAVNTIAVTSATDAAGSTAGSLSITASVTVDNTAPLITSAAITGPGAKTGFTSSFTGNSVAITATEAHPYRYAITAGSVMSAPGSLSSDWKNWTTAVETISSVDLSGLSSPVRLWLKDKAGNTSAYQEIAYTYDDQNPVIHSVTINGAANSYLTSADDVPVTITFTEAVSGMWQLTFAANSFAAITSVNSNTNTPTDWEFAGNVLTLKNVTGVTGTSADLTIIGDLTAGGGGKTVTVNSVMDAAGRSASSAISGSCTVDVNSPQASAGAVSINGVTSPTNNASAALTLQLTFTELADGGSGLAAATLDRSGFAADFLQATGGTFTASGITLNAGENIYTWDSSTGELGFAASAGKLKYASALTISIPITANTMIEGSNSVTLQGLEDFAGNAAAAINISSNAVILDITAPEISGGSLTVADSGATVNGISVTDTLSLPADWTGKYDLSLENYNRNPSSATPAFDGSSISGGQALNDNETALYKLRVQDDAGNLSKWYYLYVDHTIATNYTAELIDLPADDTDGPEITGTGSLGATVNSITGLSITDTGIGVPTGSEIFSHFYELKYSADQTYPRGYASMAGLVLSDDGSAINIPLTITINDGEKGFFELTAYDRLGNSAVQYISLLYSSGDYTATLEGSEPSAFSLPVSGLFNRSVSAISSAVSSGISTVRNFFSGGRTSAASAPAPSGNGGTKSASPAQADTANSMIPAPVIEPPAQSAAAESPAAETAPLTAARAAPARPAENTTTESAAASPAQKSSPAERSTRAAVLTQPEIAPSAPALEIAQPVEAPAAVDAPADAAAPFIAAGIILLLALAGLGMRRILPVLSKRRQG